MMQYQLRMYGYCQKDNFFMSASNAARMQNFIILGNSNVELDCSSLSVNKIHYVGQSLIYALPRVYTTSSGIVDCLRISVVTVSQMAS